MRVFGKSKLQSERFGHRLKRVLPFDLVYAMLDQSAVSNRLLRHLSIEDFALLAAYFEPVDLHRDYVLAKPNTRILDVFFIESGMV